MVSKPRKQKCVFSILPKNERKTFALVGRSNFGKYFVRFLGDSRTSIFAFEIYWPLGFGTDHSIQIIHFCYSKK